MAQKITHYLLIALVLSLGFGQLLRFEYFGVPIYLHDVLVLCLLLFLLQRSVLKRKTWLQAKLGSAAAERTDLYGTFGFRIFLISLALGWFFALLHYPITQLLVPTLYTLRLLAYIALYLVLKQSKIKITFIYFLIGGMVQLFIGLIQYFFLPDMRVFQYLGWDDHLSRLTLPHFDPTFTAVMLGLFVLTLKRSQWFIGVMVLWSILLTYSRSAWLSLVLTALLFIKNTKIFLISLFLFLICITFWLPKKFGEGTNLLRTYSITSRFESDLAYIQKYKWDLLVGRGMNTLILDAPSIDVPNHASGPNNSYLYLLATTGILGLAGWGIFMFSLYTRSAHKPMMIFFFIASLFNNVMFYPFALLWVLLVESTVPTSA